MYMFDFADIYRKKCLFGTVSIFMILNIHCCPILRNVVPSLDRWIMPWYTLACIKLWYLHIICVHILLWSSHGGLAFKTGLRSPQCSWGDHGAFRLKVRGFWFFDAKRCVCAQKFCQFPSIDAEDWLIPQFRVKIHPLRWGDSKNCRWGDSTVLKAKYPYLKNNNIKMVPESELI